MNLLKFQKYFEEPEDRKLRETIELINREVERDIARMDEGKWSRFFVVFGTIGFWWLILYTFWR